MTLKWAHKALRELDAQLDYIELDKPSAAIRMADLIIKATNMLADWPELGKPGRAAGTRIFVIPGTPFLAVYKLTQTQVIITRLLHGAQK